MYSPRIANHASGGDAEGDRVKNFEKIEGSAYHDVLRGSNEGNVLIGGAGNDILDGTSGGSKRDFYTGGDGNDIFVLNGVKARKNNKGRLDGESAKSITDFTQGEDLLDVRGYKDLYIEEFNGATYIYALPDDFTGYSNATGNYDTETLAILLNFTGTLTIDDFIHDYTSELVPDGFI